MAVSEGLVGGIEGHGNRQLGENVRLVRFGKLVAVIPHGLGPDHKVQHGDTGLSGKNASRCTPPESVTIFLAWLTSEMEVW